jgi:hypothetical protein
MGGIGGGSAYGGNPTVARGEVVIVTRIGKRNHKINFDAFRGVIQNKSTTSFERRKVPH